MSTVTTAFRLTASTGTHRGDRQYQQDQVEVLEHPRKTGCVLSVVADGMGGKSGGRKAADQVLLTCRQIFERFVPEKDDAGELMCQLVMESHLMIKLTAIASEQEPHSTIAAFMVLPSLACHVVHAGDSRVYHFRGSSLLKRTSDHSFVQRLVDQGKLTDEAAKNHPQSNLLTGCLGTQQDPPAALWHIDRLEPGDTLMACSDGLWHYFNDRELGAILHALTPRQACEMLVEKSRQRAQGSGDNLSLAVVQISALK